MKSRIREIRLTFLTGPLTNVGRFTVYHFDSRKAVRFASELIGSFGAHKWRVRLTDIQHPRLTIASLHAEMESMPLWCYEEIRKLKSGKPHKCPKLKQLLPVFGILCHDRGRFSVEITLLDSRLRLIICKQWDIHVYAPPELMQSVTELARRQHLREPPSDYDTRLLITPSACEMNVELGYLEKKDVSKRDVRLRPSDRGRKKRTGTAD